MKIALPKYIKECLTKIEDAGYEAYVVGGAVRDAYMGKEPSDWDITTNAKTDVIGKIFPHHFDTGLKHGTVTVLCDGNNVEITTYRIDGEYNDCRRPESVIFTDDVTKDLERRDFTINAIAYSPTRGTKDPFGGIEDINSRIIKAVGNPDKRFNEDALRIMRGVRFSAVLDFNIEADTYDSIKKNAELLNNISAERIKKELDLYLLSGNKVNLLRESGILRIILPEIEHLFNIEQNNPWHIYNVGEHTFEALRNSSESLVIKYALLLHDLGKAVTKTTDEKGIDHFHGHPLKSVDMARDILNRLKFDNDTKNKVLSLIECHDIRPEPTEKSIKRFLSRHNNINFEDYISVRICDSKAQNPQKHKDTLTELSTLKRLYNKINEEKQPYSEKDLKINGNDIKNLGYTGKEIGDIKRMLLDMVIENPMLNDNITLINLAKAYK